MLGGVGRVLVVDDEYVLRHLLGEVLTEEGHENVQTILSKPYDIAHVVRVVKRVIEQR